MFKIDGSNTSYNGRLVWQKIVFINVSILNSVFLQRDFAEYLNEWSLLRNGYNNDYILWMWIVTIYFSVIQPNRTKRCPTIIVLIKRYYWYIVEFHYEISCPFYLSRIGIRYKYWQFICVGINVPSIYYTISFIHIIYYIFCFPWVKQDLTHYLQKRVGKKVNISLNMCNTFIILLI